MTSFPPTDVMLRSPRPRKSALTPTSSLWSRLITSFRHRNSTPTSTTTTATTPIPTLTIAHEPTSSTTALSDDSWQHTDMATGGPTPNTSTFPSPMVRSFPAPPDRSVHGLHPVPPARQQSLPSHLSQLETRHPDNIPPPDPPPPRLVARKRIRPPTRRSTTPSSTVLVTNDGPATVSESSQSLPIDIPVKNRVNTIHRRLSSSQRRKSESQTASSRRNRSSRKSVDPRSYTNDDLRCAQTPSGLFDLDTLLGLRVPTTSGTGTIQTVIVDVNTEPMTRRPTTAPATTYDAWDDYLHLLPPLDLPPRSPLTTIFQSSLPDTPTSPPSSSLVTSTPTFLSLKPTSGSTLHRPHPLRQSPSVLARSSSHDYHDSPLQLQQRKEAAAAAERTRIEEELKANGGKVDEAELERQGLTVACEDLGVEMHEITPDGHCLYAAIADQLNLLGKGSSSANGGSGGKENYKTTRRTTARWMREHEDDFRPFISDNDELMAGVGSPGDNDKKKRNGGEEDPYLSYCDAVENTAVWGGQPEILAMSRAYRTPIWVIQSGSPIVKVGQDEFPSDSKPLMISYHRKMYGLGEHYNSLRSKSLMGSARRKIGGF